MNNTNNNTTSGQKGTKMNASDYTYGVEFELTLPANTVTVGSYFNGLPIDAATLPGWVLKSDSSIHAERGRIGAELVSPILRGADGLRQIRAALAWVNARGCKVNTSCGFHVHVGWDKPATHAATKRLVFLVANFETAILASTGTPSRANNHYCGSVANDDRFQTAFRFARNDVRIGNRYHILNLTNLGTTKNTVEFRAFAGTYNFAKAAAYVRLCVGLCQRADTTTRTTGWVAKAPEKTSCVARKGDGETALARLMYQLGWTKGRVASVYGNVAENDDAGFPTIKESKKELFRLAKKFDARTA